MRERLDQAFDRWGQFVAARAWWIIFGMLIATGLVATQLQHFRFDASMDGFFHPDDPVRIRNNAFRDLFGRDSFIAVSLTPREGVFDPDFLEELRTLHEEIEDEVPLLVDITSLINARETLGREDTLHVGELFEEWPENATALALLEERARANPLYRNNLLAADGRTTAIVLETEPYSLSAETDELEGFDESSGTAPGESESLQSLTGAEDLEIVTALQSVLERHRRDDLEIRLAGTPAFSVLLSQNIGADMGRFTVLSLAIVAGFLALLFRRIEAVILPLVSVSLSVIATLAIMAMADVPMMPPTQMVPSFLLAVGIGGAVHLLSIFYQAQRRGEEKVASIRFALSHSGVPIVMTSLTTAAGLLSFIPAAMRPITHFGIFAPLGVILSLIFVLTLLPALMTVMPMRAAKLSMEETASQRGLVSAGRYATRHAVLVLAIWGGLMVISTLGLFRVKIGHDMLEWFPEQAPMHEAMHFMNDEFGGAASYELLVSTGLPNGLHDPETLRRVERLGQHVEQFEHSKIRGGKVISIVDVVKETHRALNENRDDFYAIPGERSLVSQELLLFENSGSDDVEDLVTSDFESARMSVRVPFVDATHIPPYVAALVPEVERILGPDMHFELTGSLMLLGNAISACLDTMIRSYSTALLVVTALMIALIGRFRLGLLSMIPNLAPVIFTLGLMGWLGIPLDTFTLLIGTIVIGLAVDDTIHFMHSFRRELARTGEVESAVGNTLRGTGQALLFTSCVLACGFLVYTQAYMIPMFGFGLLTAAAICVAFLADLTLAPALVATAIRADAERT